MLQAIAELYATSYVFQFDQIMQWRSVLEEKYSALSGITNLHDFNTSKVAADSVIKYRSACYGGSYQAKGLGRLSSIIDKDILATDDSLFSDSLLFCTPEALVRSKWRYAIDDPTVSDRVVALVVDEAHCISKW